MVAPFAILLVRGIGLGVSRWWESQKEWNTRLEALRHAERDLTVDQAKAVLRGIYYTQRWMGKQGGFDAAAISIPDGAFFARVRAVWEITATGQGMPLPLFLELPGVLPMLREFFHLHPCAGECGRSLYDSEPQQLEYCRQVREVNRCRDCWPKRALA